MSDEDKRLHWSDRQDQLDARNEQYAREDKEEAIRRNIMKKRDGK